MDLKFLTIVLLSLFKSSFIISSYNLAKIKSGDIKHWMDEALSVTFSITPFSPLLHYIFEHQTKSAYLGEKSVVWKPAQHMPLALGFWLQFQHGPAFHWWREPMNQQQ